MRAVVIVCLLSGVARAGGDIPLDAFRPAVDSRGFVTVDGAAVLDPGQLSFGLVTSWSKKPLDGIDDLISPTLVGAIGVFDRAELGVALPLGIVSGDGVAAQGLGDLTFDGKVTIDRHFAIVGTASLPTGAKDAWLSANRTSLGARLVGEVHAGPFRFGANAGVRAPIGGDELGMSMSLGPALPVGGAIAWEAAPGKIELVAEGFAVVPMRGDGYFPIEALGAARFYLAHASHLELGVGAGLGGAGGNPELRAFLGIVFEPTSPEHASAKIEIADAAPPPPPKAAPPDDPEPRYGDRDGDGFNDHDDLCPDEPGVAQWGGCPESDFQHDAVADVEDRCDRDACPDRDIVRMGDTVLITLEDINFEFDSAVIKKDSYHVLDAIVDTLQANSDVTSVEVGGHTDERGPDAYNLDLSQRRADAVMAYLVAHGVDQARLSAQGYGERVPKVEGHDEHAWRINRRVEFVILHRSS
ncbi:MAG TPA: OmpA family protein [Kofleriaceae bacterium]|nr:OmpA family protein [Kofleriaceae bacterium]